MRKVSYDEAQRPQAGMNDELIKWWRKRKRTRFGVRAR